MKVIKLILICVGVVSHVLMLGDSFLVQARKDQAEYLELGLLDSSIAWVYLCGLTRDWHDSLELENREKLSSIGKNLGIRFIALKPFHRSAQFDDKLCWPHDSAAQTLKTYDQILNRLADVKISGFVGFSNGGFFLTKLAQCKHLDVPVICIGSAGYFERDLCENNLYLLIGKLDEYHIQGAHQLYEKSKNSKLHVELIEYENGHVIPKQLLQSLIGQLMG